MIITEYLRKQSKSRLIALAFLAVILCGLLDYYTGPEISFSIFYLAPISAAAWFAGKYVGLLIAIASALTWFLADMIWGVRYQHQLIPYWNVIVRLCFFVIVNCLISRMKDLHVTLEEKIKDKTALLNKELEDRKLNEEILNARYALLQYAFNHSLDELLEETLNQAEKISSSLIGFYHLVDTDQNSLTLQNWSTNTKLNFCKARGKGLHYEVSKAGVWVDCIHQRRPVIHNDYASLLHKKGIPQGHAEIIRELVVPVFRGNKIMAVLGVGNKQSAYNERDVKSVSILADLAWDIAEIKKSEEKIEITHKLLQETEQMGKVGGWEFDIDTEKQKWTDEVYRIHEIDTNFETTVISGISFYTPESKPVIEHAVKMAIEHGEPFDLELEIITAKGNRRYVHAIGKADIKNRRVYGFFQDITNRKHAELSAKRLADEWQKTFDTVANPIFIRDSDGVITMCNTATEKLTGKSANQIIGRKCWEIMHNTSEPIPDCPIHAMGDSKKREGLMLPVGDRFFQIYVDPIIDRTGKVLGAIHIMEDVTERERSREEREKLLFELQNALKEIKTLHGILPICSYCKKIKDEKGNWGNLDSYVITHTDAQLSHGMCPDCAEKAIKEFQEFKRKSGV